MKKIFSRLFFAFICAVSAFSFVACGNKNPNEKPSLNNNPIGAGMYVIDDDELVNITAKTGKKVAAMIEKTNDTGAYENSKMKGLASKLSIVYNTAYILRDISGAFDDQNIQLNKIYEKPGDEKYVLASANSSNTELCLTITTNSVTDGFYIYDYKIKVDKGNIKNLHFKYLETLEDPKQVLFAEAIFDFENSTLDIYSGFPVISSYGELTSSYILANMNDNDFFKIVWGNTFMIHFDLNKNAETPFVCKSLNNAPPTNDICDREFKTIALNFDFVALYTKFTTCLSAPTTYGNDIIFEYLNGAHITFDSITNEFKNDVKEDSNV